MALEVRLPRFSEEMKEGTVTRWLKAVGDAVAEGEPIAEVETEKVIVEVVAPKAGVLLDIRAAEQTVVAVDGVLCRIGEVGELAGRAAPQGIESGRAPPGQPAPKRRPAERSSPAQSAASAAHAEASFSPSTRAPAAAASSGSEPATRGPGQKRVASSPPNVVSLSGRPSRQEAPGAPGGPPLAAKAAAAAHAATAGPREASVSPLARRVAAELELDLARVQGTGIGGKIVVSDLEPFLAARRPRAGHAGKDGGALPAGVAAAAGQTLGAAGPEPAAFGAVEVPHSPLRKTIARRMTESKATIPHFYMTAAVDATDLLALRAHLNGTLPEGPVSLNDFLLKATAVALREEPALNAEYGEHAVRRHEAVHLGFAVATDAGLYTPVVRDCHLKSVGAIARDAQALAAKAKARSLAAADVQGGTFTVSNLGMYDVAEFSAIINPPQVAILAVARPQERPVACNGRVIVRAFVNVTVSADHRALDGVTVAKFLQAFRAAVEAPERLLV